MLKKISSFCSITCSIGFYTHKKTGSYGQRLYWNEKDNVEEIATTYIVEALCVPFLCGYHLSGIHDKVLYIVNQKHYQKELDDYKNEPNKKYNGLVDHIKKPYE